jgi:DDE superfamily endonuclease
MSVEYTPSKHGRVLQLCDLNYSHREIEKITGVSKTTAQETVKRDKNHHTQKSLPHSGRPSTITTRNCRQVIHELKQHRFEPYIDEGAGTKGKKKGGRGLNGSKYVTQVLKGPLKEFVKEMEREREHSMLVVEDGAPGHTSKLASQARSELGIKKLPHPLKSPNLNPIEPLWYVLKTRIAVSRANVICTWVLRSRQVPMG